MTTKQKQTTALLRRYFTQRGYWAAENSDGRFTLNTSGAWDEPIDEDPEYGDICYVWADEDGDVHWHWQWESHGYDEHLMFYTVSEWKRFYRHFLRYGIDDTHYGDYTCDQL